MAKSKKKQTAQLIERNPVILSLHLLRDMQIKEEEHSRFSDQWVPLWGFLVAYRDSLPTEAWNQDLYDAILAGEVSVKNEAWKALNACLNTIWEKASAAPF